MATIVISVFATWLIISILIAIGDTFLGQDVLWDDWFIIIVCFPYIIISIPFELIVIKIKKIKKKRGKNNDSRLY